MAKSTGKKLAIFCGICTIIAVLSDRPKSKVWKDMHAVAAIAGAAATVLGAVE